MNDIYIRINVENGVKVPEYAHLTDAGADIFSCDDYVIASNETKMIKTGIRIEIPKGYVGLLFSRSGLSTKGLALANGVGVIDSDYRGEVGCPLYNRTNDDFVIKKGERVAQLVIMPYCTAKFISVDSLTKTERGVGGFGSTGY